MANTYRATTPFAEAVYQPGEFEAEFTPTEEQDALAAGVEIVPRPYTVLSDNYAAGQQGDQVELALPVEIEAALISGGHLERVEPKPKKSTPKKKDD